MEDSFAHVQICALTDQFPSALLHRSESGVPSHGPAGLFPRNAPGLLPPANPWVASADRVVLAQRPGHALQWPGRVPHDPIQAVRQACLQNLRLLQRACTPMRLGRGLLPRVCREAQKSSLPPGLRVMTRDIGYGLCSLTSLEKSTRMSSSSSPHAPQVGAPASGARWPTREAPRHRGMCWQDEASRRPRPAMRAKKSSEGRPAAHIATSAQTSPGSPFGQDRELAVPGEKERRGGWHPVRFGRLGAAWWRGWYPAAATALPLTAFG